MILAIIVPDEIIDSAVFDTCPHNKLKSCVMKNIYQSFIIDWIDTVSILKFLIFSKECKYV